jgi:CheY-like chemotaxis protein
MDGVGTFSIRCFQEEGTIRLDVTDTGRGMQPAVMARVFEPFYTTKERGRGTGLGLATAHAIAIEHEGSIEVESTVGVGTTFRIRLPLSELAVDAEPPRVRKARTDVRQGRILVVDDTRLTLEVVCRQLERCGYLVTPATSGTEALGVLRAGEFVPDLLIADVVMPGMTGPDLVSRVSKLMPHVPFLFMSGYLDDALSLESIDVDNDLILKPFSRELLVDKVERKLLRTVSSPLPPALE